MSAMSTGPDFEPTDDDLDEDEFEAYVPPADDFRPVRATWSGHVVENSSIGLERACGGASPSSARTWKGQGRPGRSGFDLRGVDPLRRPQPGSVRVRDLQAAIGEAAEEFVEARRRLVVVEGGREAAPVGVRAVVAASGAPPGPWQRKSPKCHAAVRA
jgi:hypothetical protein